MMIGFKEMIEKYGLDIKGVIHVGAHEGGETLHYVNQRIKNVVMIEANPHRYEHLVESLNTGRYCVWCTPLQYKYFNDEEAEILKGYKSHNYAITDKEDGTITFNLSNYDGGTDSVFKINEWGRDSSWVPYEHVDSVDVPTTTLDKLIQNTADYNFLNIDVEGAELLVLKGAHKLLDGIDYIMLESQDKIRFEGSCTREELVHLLKEYNFELVEYFDTGKQWGDCLFKKTNK